MFLLLFLPNIHVFFCLCVHFYLSMLRLRLYLHLSQLLFYIHSKTSFENNCFSAWASTLNMGLINEVDMVCLSPVGYGV